MNNNTKNRICFIIPYFGEFPSYFPLFLNSVEDQPFDLIFLTDSDCNQQLTENVSWQKTSLTEIEKLCKSKLNIDIKIENPHKLCDFKPAYGLLFEQLISSYEFWGTIDIDTIAGNFRNFFSDQQLTELDFFSGVKEYVSGSLFFIRNNSFCNNLFKSSRDWAVAFTDKKYVGFDECGGPYFSQLQAGASIMELNTRIQSFTEIILSAKDDGLRCSFTNYILEPKGAEPVSITEHGIFYYSTEYLMVHFIYFKTSYFFYTKTSVLPAPYYINSLGMFKNKPTSLKMLFSYNMIVAVGNKLRINLAKLMRLYKKG